jgi:hypothetical protein
MTTISLTPAPVKWTIYEGATFKQQILVLTSGIGSPPVDLTNYHGVLTVWNMPAQDILLQLTDANGGLTFGGTAGTIEVYIPSATTSLLTWRTAFFDLLAQEPGGDLDALIRGNFTVTGNRY